MNKLFAKRTKRKKKFIQKKDKEVEKGDSRKNEPVFEDCKHLVILDQIASD